MKKNIFPQTDRSCWTVQQVQQEWLTDAGLARLQKNDNEVCPCCNKHVQIYKRRPHRSMCVGLNILVVYLERHDLEYARINDVFRGLDPCYRGDLGKFLLWELVKQMPGQRADGNPETGYWGVTDDGKQFVANKLEMSEWVLEYKSEVLASAETFIDFASVTENFDYDRDIRALYEESARRAEKKSAEAQVVKRELADPTGREPVSLEGSA